jgi:histidyl-tRNA synthetase
VAAHKYQAPRGTFDVLPEAARLRGRIERTAAAIFARAGYEPIATPSFEDTELFERGVGHSTDIVRKEMFTFEDKGGRSLTLRPEGTAPICRAYVEHGMQVQAQPVKLSYLGPFFRHERPQAGRYRQFHQVGAEAIGSDSPAADAEAVVMLDTLLKELKVPEVELRLGSLASIEARRSYLEELKSYLHAHEADLSKDVRERIDLNPLRAFDSDEEGTHGVMADAPTLVDRLEGEDAAHFKAVRAYLDVSGVKYTIDPTLVRGLDYYTRTIFSFTCDRLGSQSELGGGGRYDGLIEQLGGPPTPAVGWAVGIERILLALGDAGKGEPGPRPVFISFNYDAEIEQAMALSTDLRKAGVATEFDLGGRSAKGQLKHANRIGARLVVFLHGDAPAQVRDMDSGEQHEVDPARLVAELTGSET